MLQHLVTDVPVSEWVSEWVIDKFCLEVVMGCLEDVWCLYGGCPEGLCCFNPFSVVALWPHSLQEIEAALELISTFSAVASSAPLSTTSSAALFWWFLFLFSSLGNWLGDFFFFFQELFSSLLLKKSLSFPMERFRANFWSDLISDWQKAKHFSTADSTFSG